MASLTQGRFANYGTGALAGGAINYGSAGFFRSGVTFWTSKVRMGFISALARGPMSTLAIPRVQGADFVDITGVLGGDTAGSERTATSFNTNEGDDKVSIALVKGVDGFLVVNVEVSMSHAAHYDLYTRISQPLSLALPLVRLDAFHITIQKEQSDKNTTMRSLKTFAFDIPFEKAHYATGLMEEASRSMTAKLISF